MTRRKLSGDIIESVVKRQQDGEQLKEETSLREELFTLRPLIRN